VKFDLGLVASMLRVSSESLRCIRKKIRTISESWKTFRVQKLVHSLEVDAVTHRVYAPEQEEGKRTANQ
jgi:hypothetical protein